MIAATALVNVAACEDGLFGAPVAVEVALVAVVSVALMRENLLLVFFVQDLLCAR